MLKQACFSRLVTPDAPWLDPLVVSVTVGLSYFRCRRLCPDDNRIVLPRQLQVVSECK